MKNLNQWDVLGVLVCWCGAAAVGYFSQGMVVGIVGVGCAYYLSRLIILKSE